MPAKKLTCGWCGEVIRAKPWAYYRPPGEKVFVYVMHTACSRELFFILNSPAIERERNAIMRGPKRIYDWERDKWY